MVDVGSQHLPGARTNNLKLFGLIGIDVQLIFFIWTGRRITHFDLHSCENLPYKATTCFSAFHTAHRLGIITTKQHLRGVLKTST